VNLFCCPQTAATRSPTFRSEIDNGALNSCHKQEECQEYPGNSLGTGQQLAVLVQFNSTEITESLENDDQSIGASSDLSVCFHVVSYSSRTWNSTFSHSLIHWRTRARTRQLSEVARVTFPAVGSQY
jgi:hypothetical protein